MGKAGLGNMFMPPLPLYEGNTGGIDQNTCASMLYFDVFGFEPFIVSSGSWKVLSKVASKFYHWSQSMTIRIRLNVRDRVCSRAVLCNIFTARDADTILSDTILY